MEVAAPPLQCVELLGPTMCCLWVQIPQGFFFLSEDGQEWAMSPELEVDEAQRAWLSEHRVPDPGQRRETGMAASCPSSGALQRWETTGLSF